MAIKKVIDKKSPAIKRKTVRPGVPLDYKLLFETSPVPSYIFDLKSFRLLNANRLMLQRYGYTRNELLNMTAKDLRPAEHMSQLNLYLKRVKKEKGVIHFGLMVHKGKDGKWFNVDISGKRIQYEGKDSILVLANDISEKLIHARLDQLERKVIELSISGKTDFPELFAFYLKGLEKMYPGLYSSIMCVTGNRLFTLSAPSLPGSYSKSLNNVEIGPVAGSCGTAAYLKKMIIVTDIEQDPLWKDYRKLAMKYGLKACWSTPLYNSQGNVIATFANYYKTPRKPSKAELEVFNRTSSLLSLLFDYYHKEQQLEKSHERFQFATSATTDLIWDLDVESGQITWGERIADLTGLKQVGKIPGISEWIEFVHEEDRNLVQKTIKQGIKGKSDRWEIEYRIRKKSGETVWLWDRALIIRNKQKKAIRVVGAIRDMSQMKKNDEWLKLLENIIVNSQEALLITTPSTFKNHQPEIVYVNPAFCAMTGYTEKELVGNTPLMLQGPLSKTAALREIEKKLLKNEPCLIQSVNYRKNGEPYRVEISVKPITDSTGNITHYFAIERDITAQYRVDIRSRWMATVRTLFNQQKDLRIVLKQMLKELNEFGAFMSAEIWVLSANKRSFNLLAWHANDKSAEIYYKENKQYDSLNPESGLLKEVCEKRELVVWDNLESRTSLIRLSGVRKAGFRSALSLPLMFNGEVIGALTVLSEHADYALEEFRWLLEGLSGELGAEMKRKQLEDELSIIFHSSPAILAIASADGYFKKISPAARALLGYSEEELLSQPFLSFLHPEDREKAETQINTLSGSEHTILLELRVRTKQGSYKWMEWSVVESKSEGYLFGMGKDISQQKGLQQLLDNANRVSRIGAWELDMTTNKITWSDLMREIHEVGPDFIPDLNYSRMFYRPDKYEETDMIVRSAQEKGLPFDIEFPIVTAKGNERWVRAICTPEFSGGVCVRLYGSFQDIHDRKKAELELAQRTDYLSVIAFVAQRLLEVENWYTAASESFEIVRETLAADKLFLREIQQDTITGEWQLLRRIAWVKELDRPVLDDPEVQHIAFSYYTEIIDVLFKQHSYAAVYSDLQDSLLKQVMKENHVKSVLFLPVFAGQQLVAVLGVEDYSTERIWTSGELFFLRSICSGLSAAIQRFNSRDALNKLLGERNAMLESIRISNERFERVMEATNDAIWDFDIINRMVYLGPGFRKNFGHEVSKDWVSFDQSARQVHPDDKELVENSFKNSVSDPACDTWVCEFRILKSGEGFADVINRSSIIRDENRRALRVVGALTDISFQKEYERSLRKLNEDLEKQTIELSSSNKELEQFAYVASHDLQEPLRMVTSFLSKLNDKYAAGMDDRGKQYIGFAVDGAKRMRQNILDLLQYSRVGKGNAQAEEIHLQEVMEEICLLHKSEIDECGAIIEFSNLPVIRHYIVPVTQVLNNLVGNALKYRNPGVAPRIIVEARPETDKWLFCVRDNGIGIEQEYLQKIFVIFQRLHSKETYPGTGIGLAVVKKVVEGQGGKIWVESTPGKGSAFYFTLLPVRD